jgi:hypothetical protein
LNDDVLVGGLPTDQDDVAIAAAAHKGWLHLLTPKWKGIAPPSD